MSRKIALYILVGIIIASAILRFWHLGENPFRADEFLDINATVGYAQTGQWQAWDHNMNRVSTRINPASDARAWLYRMQVAQLFHFFPPTEFIARSVSALWGVITTALIYLVATSLTRRREIGLIGALLFALSINAIELDRMLRMYAMFAPVFLLLAWLIFLTLERIPKQGFLRKTYRYCNMHIGFASSALFVGILSLHLHLLTVNIVFVIIGYLLVMFFVQVENRKKYIIFFNLIVLSFIILWLFVPQSIAQFLDAMVFFDDHYSYISIVLRDFQHPLIGVVMTILGAVMLWRSGQKKESVWIGLLVGIILGMAIFLWRRNVGPQYIFFIQPFVLILVASGIYHIAQYFVQQLYGKKIFTIVLVIAFFFVPNYGYFFQENNTYHKTSHADTPNYRKVFTYVQKRRGSNDVLITRNFRNYYWSGAHIKTFDFGSERSADALAQEGKVAKITLPYLQQIIAQNPSGWVVFSDNDEKFISKEARKWIAQNMAKESHSSIRGKISLYRWGNTQ